MQVSDLLHDAICLRVGLRERGSTAKLRCLHNARSGGEGGVGRGKRGEGGRERKRGEGERGRERGGGREGEGEREEEGEVGGEGEEERGRSGGINNIQ